MQARTQELSRATLLVGAFAALAVAVSFVGAPAIAGSGVPDGKDFGAGLTLREPVSLQDVVRDPERFAGSPILLSGRITDVCQKKGCWTVLADGDAFVRVRFKDYGFFLPTDCSGKQAWVEGEVEVQTLSEKTARHYASESKSVDPSSIEGPQREVGFTASGVRLVRAD